MGKKDVATKEYMRDPARVADLLNGFLYHGEERVHPQGVKDLPNELTRQPAEEEQNLQTVTADVMLAVDTQMRTMIVALENQSDIHYAMPIRVLNLEAIGYHRQWKESQKEHQEKKDLSGAEFLSGFAKDEKVKPFLPIVIYFGQTAWDGPRCLKDMINLEAYPPEVRELITDYPLHLIEVRKYEGYEDFKTDLKYVFGILRNADTKDSMKTYVEENAEALRSLDTDAYDVISVMGQMKDLQRIKEKYQNEDGRSYDMCKGMQEWLEEKLEEGLEQGLDKQRYTLIHNVENAMKNFSVDLEGACLGLGVTVEEYHTAKTKLEQRQQNESTEEGRQ